MICGRIKKYLVQLNDTGMADELEDVNFSGYSFDVSHVDDLFLDEDLDGYFFPCQGMSGQLDFTKGALANSLT